MPSAHLFAILCLVYQNARVNGQDHLALTCLAIGSSLASYWDEPLFFDDEEADPDVYTSEFWESQ